MAALSTSCRAGLLPVVMKLFQARGDILDLATDLPTLLCKLETIVRAIDSIIADG